MKNLTTQISLIESFTSEIVMILGQKWFVRSVSTEKGTVLCERFQTSKQPAQFRLEWFLENHTMSEI